MQTPVERRGLIKAGAGSLTGAALAPEASSAEIRPDDPSQNELIVRQYYKLWEERNWNPFDTILSDDFTFTSPNGDDHINKITFKQRCWDTQVDFISTFDIELLIAKDDAVFVKYLCHTRNGKSFRNVELHRLRGQKITAIECYFGAASAFPSAVSSQEG
jgi:hypothetical protein